MKYLLTHKETERLRFRLLEAGDFNEWVHLFKVDNVAKYLGLDVELSEKELCKEWFDRVFKRYENDLGGMNVLIDKATNKMVGQCGLLIQTVENIERLEIGYSILPNYWNKGYATEAAIKCKNYAFEQNFAASLISIVHIENKASELVAIKNGMLLEKQIEYHGNPVNIFRIDKSQWLK